MVLTINYEDLQNIKKQMISDKTTDEESIFKCIQGYKETLDNMYKKNLVLNKDKTDLELELKMFANEMLKNTNKSYKEIEKQYGDKTTKDYIIGPKDIRLIL